MLGYFKLFLKLSCNDHPEETKDTENPEERLGKAIIEQFQDEIKCSICLKTMYRCRTVAPCLHNFCSFCLSEYLSRNYWHAICPICRGDVHSWNKNPLFDKLIECMSEYSPEFETSEEEKQLRDERDILIKGAKIQKHEWSGTYFGFLKNDKREGKGKFLNYFQDEYDGDWKDDKKEGYGELNCWDGSRYKGEWKDGKIEGFGEEISANGDIYKGFFLDNKREGKGECFYVNGKYYKGEWKDGKRHGLGEFTWPDGRVDVGEWKNDRFAWPHLKGEARRDQSGGVFENSGGSSLYLYNL